MTEKNIFLILIFKKGLEIGYKKSKTKIAQPKATAQMMHKINIKYKYLFRWYINSETMKIKTVKILSKKRTLYLISDL